MNAFKQLYRQKMLWFGLLAVALVVMVLSFALLGSTVNPVPKNLPAAIVMEDAGAKLPDGSEINFGRQIEEKLTAPANSPAAPASPLQWTKEASTSDAADALDRQKYYAVLVIPADTTKQLLSLQTPAASPAQAELFINQGKNYSGSSMAAQALDKIVAAVNTQLREQLLGEIKKRGDAMNTAQAAAMAAPILVKQTVVHPVTAKTANGSAPVNLTQLAWMGALAATVIQLQSSRRTGLGKRSYPLLLSQVSSGLLLGLMAVSAILFTDVGIIGLDIPDFWPVAGYLCLVFGVFFLLQSALVQFLGMAGLPVLVVLFFFGLPILALPYEVLPGITQHWFFTWVPFRFSVEGFRDLFYFRQGLGWKEPAMVLVFIGLGSLLVLLASPLVSKRSRTAAAEENSMAAGHSGAEA